MKIRPVAGGALARVAGDRTLVQRRVEERGPYADPWTLIAAKYGTGVLAATDG